MMIATPTGGFLSFTTKRSKELASCLYNDRALQPREHSWHDMGEIHEYDSLEALLSDVKVKFIDSRKNEIGLLLGYSTYI